VTHARWAEVVRPGTLSTLQDRGRPGWAHLGVPRSGALDPPAHALANRLVGNDPSAATVETTLDGVALRVSHRSAAAVTGARAPVLVNGQGAPWGLPLPLRAGDVLEVGRATAGVRSYVAVGGGFVVPPVLGSRATDLLSGLGPPPLAAGSLLPVGAPSGDAAPLDMAPYPEPSRHIRLTVHPGPRRDWLAEGASRSLFAQAFEVSPESNRVALRLRGSPLERRLDGELPSEGLVWGSVQLLPDGQLVIFLADHPTTGGYPVVGVVDPAGASACAQAAPGTTLGLRPARLR
jgi:biotin-dependent carboxylase-like uncharacterized protein